MPALETAWNLARLILLGLVLLVLFLRMFEEKLVFFPNAYSAEEWGLAEHGVTAEEVYFSTHDGVRLHAFWARTPGAGHTFLYFHGNAGNLSDRIPNVGFLQRLPANVLAVDYRGYGKSDARPTEAGVYRDAEAAYDYLVRERKIPPEQIVVLGQSLGTAVAVDLAAKRAVGGLVLECGFPSAARVAQEHYWFLPGLRFVMRSKFDSAAKLKNIQAPVLVAHCREDPVIPFALGEELFAAASEPKTFVAYPGFCHEPLYHADPDDYAAKLRAFLESATKTQRH
jgi:hypothetical protein